MLSHDWMREEGIAGWLLPSEFMDVNYGAAIKKYLLEKVTLLHIHRFDPDNVQFSDALVSSVVVWFKKAKPPANHSVKFTFGGELLKPKLEKFVSIKDLSTEAKWTRFPAASIRCQTSAPSISDFFTVKRGIATGDNSYFILNKAEIERRCLPMEVFRPILPSPRYITRDIIDADSHGIPLLERRLFLLDLDLTEDEIKDRFPNLWIYLEEGKDRGVHERYLCRHRTKWYSQEKRPVAPIVCTYLGRGNSSTGRPFRFLLNKSKATVANVYLAMYPKPILKEALIYEPNLIHKVWETLNTIRPNILFEEGRVYGGGLYKMEPKELANVPVPDLADILNKYSEAEQKQFELQMVY